MEESRRRPLTGGFRCGESIEDDGALRFVIFHCSLTNGDRMEFSCREPSCGALEAAEDAAVLADDDYYVDPNFFDEAYTLAGKTGFKVWTGSRLLIETLTWPQPSDCARLTQIQGRISSGAKICELGAGVGVVGTYLAANGANVLITDLPTLVENAIDCNLERNKTRFSHNESSGEECPSWLQPHGLKIRKGWADSTPIDWTCPIDEQLTEAQSTGIDLIVASDVVFLVEMIDSLFSTVAALFKASVANNPSFILSFQRRNQKDAKENETFSTVNGVLENVKRRGWTYDCLAWRSILAKRDEDDTVIEEETEVFVFEIKP